MMRLWAAHVDAVLVVPRLEVVHDRGLVQVGKVGDVLGPVVVWRVDWLEVEGRDSHELPRGVSAPARRGRRETYLSS